LKPKFTRSHLFPESRLFETMAPTPEQLESFINDHLKEDLKNYEQQLAKINTDISEYLQIKKVIEHIKDDKVLKTQVNIGGSFFMQAKVNDLEKMLVNVGLDVYVEFTLDEAVKYVDFKVKVLTKEADVIREESLKTRANIKLALLCIGEQQNMYAKERS
jgi:prefoldin alpha subunit